MADGLVHASEAGAPQGAPLSPLVSNVMLDRLDSELERRAHRFARYAHDVDEWLRRRLPQGGVGGGEGPRHGGRPARARGVPERAVREWARSQTGYWRVAGSHVLPRALSKAYCSNGVWSVSQITTAASGHAEVNRAVRTRTPGGVGVAESSPVPTRD